MVLYQWKSLMFPLIQEMPCSQNIPEHYSLLQEALRLKIEDCNICVFLDNHIITSNRLYDKTDV